MGISKTVNKIKILHSNINGIRQRFAELKHMTAKHSPDILIVNECNLDLNIFKYNITGYDKVFDKIAPHLGTATYVRQNLRWAKIPLLPDLTDDTDRHVEGSTIKLHTVNGWITINTVYFECSQTAERKRQIMALLDIDEAITIGDLNIESTLLNHKKDSATGRMINDKIRNGEIAIHHTGAPSRPLSRGRGVLDLAITTGSLSAHKTKCQQLDDIGSDHRPWLFTIDIQHDVKNKMHRDIGALLSSKENLQRYRHLIAKALESNENIKNSYSSHAECEAAIESLERILKEALDEVIPEKIIRPRDTLPNDIQQKLDLRAKLKNMSHTYKDDLTLKMHYQRAKREVADALMKYKETSWTKVLECGKENRKKMWTIQKSLKKPNQQLPQIDDCDTEEKTLDALVKAAIVQESNVSETLQMTIGLDGPHLEDYKVTMMDVKRAIFKFKNRKAPGPDRIQGYALKSAGPCLWFKLTHIINYVLSTGYFPQRWKLGECIFLHKSGKNTRLASSYRPITLLNTMAKICERLMYEIVLCKTGHLIPEYQHGFMRNRGTGTQILRTVLKITKELEEGNSVAMISTDLSKAFDSINHKALVYKLHKAGIENSIIRMIYHYLTNRKIRGRFRTTVGVETPVPHGVPQGSILGPLLFCLYMSDIGTGNKIESNQIQGLYKSQYADDLCLLNPSKTPDLATVRTEWAAECILDYYDKWGLHCNVDKTDCIMFTTKQKRSRSNPRGFRPHVRMRGETVDYKKSIKYLGIHLDSRLTMNEHVQHTAKKTKQIIGMLNPIVGWRSKVDLGVKLLVIKTCIVPILDYGIVQLLPRISRTNLNKLEATLRTAYKNAAQMPRCLDSKIVWEMLDEDPWHIRVSDLHNELLAKVQCAEIEGLTDVGATYTRRNQHNPMMPTSRLRGDSVPQITRHERLKPPSKRSAPPRHWCL